MQRVARMKREMQLFEQNPPHGVSCWCKEDSLENLEAQIIGPEGTPYEGGIFKMEIQIPDRYPFEPPKMRFATPVYHPNIDNVGRICLDSLKMPPKGAWKPALNISTLLTTILLLLSEPNPDDPLMADISNEFRYNKKVFEDKARQWTQKYAMTNKKVESPTGDGAQTSTNENVPSTSSESGKKRASTESSMPLQENIKRPKS